MKKLLEKVVCLFCCLSLCCMSFTVNAAASVDLGGRRIIKENILQMSHGFSLQPMNTGDTINISNSFLLYNFIEEPVAIFYKIDPVGYAIYDFKNGIVL